MSPMQKQTAALDAKVRRAAKRAALHAVKSGGKFMLIDGHSMRRKLNLKPGDVFAICDKRIAKVRSFLQSRGIAN